MPTDDFVLSRSAEFSLLDDSTVLLRPIVPQDKEHLVAAFDRLSEESRYRRFMGGIAQLRPSFLRYLTEVDYVNHYALVALGGDPPSGVGVGRYVRLSDDPHAAEAAITVVDDWHGRGLGTLMLEALGAAAIENGIRRFRAYVLAENHPMLEILRHLGAQIEFDATGVMRADIDLPAQMEKLKGTALHEALRASARGELPVIHRWEPTHL